MPRILHTAYRNPRERANKGTISGTCNFGLCSSSPRRALSSVVISTSRPPHRRRLRRRYRLSPHRRCRRRYPACSTWRCRSTADVANSAFGLIPFGYHGGGHTEDGHAGWDIEYRIGAPVRAAATGTVVSVEPDLIALGRTAVVLEHVVGEHFYRTHYTNLATISSDVVVDELILAGQPIGTAGTISAIVGDVGHVCDDALPARRPRVPS